jgi:acyl transferase domain-containing protein
MKSTVAATSPIAVQAAVPVSPLRAADDATPQQTTQMREGQFVATLERLTGSERLHRLVSLVREQVAEILGRIEPSLADPWLVDPAKDFAELGFDSRMSIELRERVQALTGLGLSGTVTFDHPTPEALARALRDRLFESDVESNHVHPVNAVESEADPIAIIAMSCRFPGDVRTPEELWELLKEGRDAISEFPEDRGWPIEALFDARPGVRGKTYVRAGGFLHDAHRFEPSFFGLSPREAIAIDPQQRLLLETAWEAIERAGVDPLALQGSPTGVFVGIMYNDYAQLGHSDDAQEYLALGSAPSIASGRVAYTLGLEGPAISIDTACSSSLVAVHLACQALRQRECSLALAGGVTVMATPTAFLMFSHQRALASDGRCRSFAAEANGTSWGEGAGMLLLERLSDARRNRHPVLALVRGSAVNQDGRSQGLTAPKGSAQERVIRMALDSARLAARDIDAVEAHGTGTPLGDPIEAQALFSTYGAARPAGAPLWLGSLKSNVGHTQAAAGVGGIIKMVLAMQHGLLPRTLHADNPSSHVDWSSGAIRLLNEAVAWQHNGHARRAGVSAFGISGTNAHIIIEEACRETAAEPAPRESCLFVLSAKTSGALETMAERLREYVSSHREERLTDVAFSLAGVRSAMPYRLAVAASTREELLAGLGVSAKRPAVGALRGRSGRAHGSLAFLFTGQGSQRLGMGRELHAEWPVFRRAFDMCTALFDAELERALTEVMWAPPDSPNADLLHTTAYAQPALFSFEYALAQLWTSLGAQPRLLAGHSIGELVAAAFAGLFSLEDAVRLVAARARLMQELTIEGAMAYIGAPEAEVVAALDQHADAVEIAALNAPGQVVISGDRTLVRRIAGGFAARGMPTRELAVSRAFHSAQMDPVLEPFRRVAETVTYARPTIPIASNLDGKLGNEEMGSAHYWTRQLRQTVRFGDGVRALRGAGADTFLEIGPKAVLSGSVRACLPEVAEHLVLPSLRAGLGESISVLEALGALWIDGRDVRLNELFAAGSRRLALPTYPWLRTRYSVPWRPFGTTLRADGHPLLGSAISVGALPGTWLWHASLGDTLRTRLEGLPGRGRPAWLAAACLEMVCWAAAETQAPGRLVLAGVEFGEPLTAPERTSQTLQLVITPSAPSRSRFELSSRVEDGAAWQRHVSGWLESSGAESEPNEDIAAIRAHCARGLAEDELALQLDLSALRERSGYAESLAVLGTCFDSAAAFAPSLGASAAVLPVSIERLILHGRPLARGLLHLARRAPFYDRLEQVRCDARVFDDQGRRVVEWAGLVVEVARGTERDTEEQIAPAMGERLRTAPPSERGALIMTILQQHLAAMLRIDPASLEQDTPLASLGIDSLLALAFRNQIGAGLGVELPADFAWKLPDLAALSGHVLAAWLVAEATSIRPESERRSSLEAGYEQETL